MDALATRSVSQRKRSHSTTAHSTSLLAVAAGSQVLTYEFINTQALQPSANTGPGQYEATQTSNERTGFSISSLKWSPDNKMLAVEAMDGRILLHDNRGQFQEALVDDPVMESSLSDIKRCVLSWTPKSQRLYFADGNRVMNWDPTSQRASEMFEMSSRINALAINNGDVLLAIGQSNGTIDVVNRSTGNMTRLNTPASMVVSKMEYSLFKQSMLGSIGNDNNLRLWDTGPSGSATACHSFTTSHDAPVSDMAFSPLNPYLVCTAGLDKQYALYDVEKKTVAMTTRTDYGLTSVAFKNENNLIAFGTVNGKVLLYDLRLHTRPIIIVDTRVDSPIRAVHFQGKQSSPSIKRHQTVSEFAPKGQNSSGTQSQPSAASGKNTLTSSKTLPSIPSISMASEDLARSTESILTRPPHSRTSSTGNYPSAKHSTRETNPASASSKSILDMFSAKPNTGLSGLTGSGSTGQDKGSHKSRQATAPPAISTSAFTQPGGASLTISGRSTPAGVTPGGITPGGITPGGITPGGITPGGNLSSVPTTPGKDAGQLGGSPYSGTTSPYTFRGKHNHRPSINYNDDADEDSSMSTSPVNASPISPEEVAGGAGSNKAGPKGHNRRLSKSPSRGLSGKYPASFPSGRTLSTPIIPDVLSDENIEMLGSHIVHQVQNALQDQGRDLDLDQDEDHDHVMRLSYNRDGATNSSGKLPRRATVTAAMGESEAVPSDSKAKAPAKDLWLQVGAEGGESSKRRAASSLSNTRPSGKGISTTTTAASIASSGSSSTLQTKVLESVVEDCLMNFRAGIRNDIQNMHLELLRQFQIQKMEMEGMLKRYTDTKELREEVERLKEENERLRMNY